MENQVTLRWENKVATLTLSTTEVINKLNSQSIKDLIIAANKAVSDGAKVLVIEGQEEYFCGGGSIGNVSALSSIQINDFGVLLQTMIFTLKTLPIPVIAAVKGHAFGGGLSLVEACDLVVCSQESEFAIPEIKGGYCPAIALVSVYTAFGNGIAKQMSMTGEPMCAQRARDLGLVTYVVEKERVEATVENEVNKILQGNSTAYRITKEIAFKLSEGNLRNAYTVATGKLVEFLSSKEVGKI